ncbi:MAG TPA: hypothetical protein VI455_00325 [Terriglobia bacterium]
MNTKPSQSGILRALPGGVAAVRRLEKWFFGEDGFSARRTIDYLLEEAALRDVSHVEVTELDGWWVLSAERDWLPRENDGLDVFHALLPFPEGGPNAARREVLVTAFAKAVATARNGNITVIVEDAETRMWIDAHEAKLRGAARVIAFAT